jgi:ABC-type histidine transport system ATPase subunit
VIDVTNVVKRYGATPVLNGATFRIAEGQLTTILGPSGCGKSTMLRCLNRLERFDEGLIRIGDVEVRGTATGRLSAAEEDDLDHRVRLRVGLVFQNFNLFPHRTALENVIEAPITVKKIRRAQAEEIGKLYLNLVGLSGREHEYPARLSGGQQQRVAIARALAMEPDVVLFDEPTSALDPELVGEVLKVIGDLAREGRTMILVTHEMKFAREVASHVVYLYNGRVEEEGPPDQVFGAPKSDRLKQFIRSAS